MLVIQSVVIVKGMHHCTCYYLVCPKGESCPVEVYDDRGLAVALCGDFEWRHYAKGSTMLLPSPSNSAAFPNTEPTFCPERPG